MGEMTIQLQIGLARSLIWKFGLLVCLAWL